MAPCVYIPADWSDGRYRYSLEPVPGWVDMESIHIDELTDRYSRLIVSPGLPPISELPRPGDVIRTNGSLCELTITRVADTHDGLHIVTRSPGGHPHYFSAVRLEHGRLLVGPRFPPDTTVGGMYPDGQKELFILERALQQPSPKKSITPVGKRAVLAAQLDLFA